MSLERLRASLATTVRREDVRSLHSFRKDYPECEPLPLYRGHDRLLVDGGRCLPTDEFLVGLRPPRPVWGGCAGLPCPSLVTLRP